MNDRLSSNTDADAGILIVIRLSTLLDRNLVLTLEVLESLLVSSGKYLVVVLAKIY